MKCDVPKSTLRLRGSEGVASVPFFYFFLEAGGSREQLLKNSVVPNRAVLYQASEFQSLLVS